MKVEFGVIVVVMWFFLGRSVGGLRSVAFSLLSPYLNSLPEVPGSASNPVGHPQVYDPNVF